MVSAFLCKMSLFALTLCAVNKVAKMLSIVTAGVVF